jgi:hypothetical protein
MRNGTAYRLPPLVPLTDATGSGLWPTPVANDDNKSPEAHMAMKARMKGGPRNTITSLNVMVKATERQLWPTPTAGDARASGSRNTASSNAHPGTSLTDAVREDGGTGRMWPTPKSSDFRPGHASRADDPRRRNLNDQVMWPTPRAHDARADFAKLDRSSTGISLETAALLWPTPNARDWRSGQGRSPNGHSEQLPERVGGQLNPQFVEWLMAFPIGWTDLRG